MHEGCHVVFYGNHMEESRLWCVNHCVESCAYLLDNSNGYKYVGLCYFNKQFINFVKFLIIDGHIGLLLSVYVSCLSVGRLVSFLFHFRHCPVVYEL